MMRMRRGSWAGTWGVLVALACSPPSTPAVGQAEPIPPEVVPAARPESEPARPKEPPELALPPGPVVSPATEGAHAAAQARMLRGERLPPLSPIAAPEPIPLVPPSLHAVTLAHRARDGGGARPALDGGEARPAPDGGEARPALGGGEAEPASGGGEAEPALEPTLAPEPMPGYFVPIAGAPQSPALAHFHAALAALAEGRDVDGKVRIAMYGASGTAADLSTGYLRTYLQARFGDGGPGFVPMAPLSPWYRHSEVRVSASKGWRKEHAQSRKGRRDGHYGLLGASFSTDGRGRWAQVEPKPRSRSSEEIARAELMFLRQPGGGRFVLKVGDEAPQTVSTAAQDFEPGYLALELPPGPHTIRLETRGDGEVRVFGVALERAEPGVVLDVLGVDGARGRSHLAWDEGLWADNLRHRAPDLYTLSYGTNESVDDDLSVVLYAEDLRAQLRRFRRVLPEASCVLLGPVDFPVRTGDQLRPRPLLREIIAVQRTLAAEEGCGFWDGVAFMGGELSMERWVNREPPLARRDYLHFNGRGAARKGMALADALMYELDAHALLLRAASPGAGAGRPALAR